MRGPAGALAVVVAAGVAACAAGCGGQDGARAAAEPPGAPSAVAHTTSGDLHGVVTRRALVFRGVRFARPPVGDLRWVAARPYRHHGPVDATRPGRRCAQSGAQATASTSEDCLVLDATTPRDARPGADLPVMVWWHGGGFTSGSGSEYDAQRLADEGQVVVVTPNYRLGILGYLGLPGLRDGGDFGFSDQLQALRWARANARALGGDPAEVTVFGQSAGGMSACALLTAPDLRPLFERIAIDSGSCALDWPAGGLLPGTPAQTPYVSRTDSERLGVATAGKLGCAGDDRLACLRRLPVAELLPASVGFSNVLAYGTRLLPRDPALALREGTVARVPVLSGGVRHEERSFVAGAEQAKPGTYTVATYPRMLRAAFGADAARVQEAYPLRPGTSPATTFADVVTDAGWACPTLRADEQLARVTRVHAFEFDDVGSPNVNGVSAKEVPQGSAHATDLPSLFDLGGRSLLRTAGQRSLSSRMIAAWAAFARTGDPSTTARPWPAYPGHVERLAPTGATSADVAAEHRCSLWDAVAR